jgi:hypothetical protein
MDVTTIVVAVLGSQALVELVKLFFTRKDKKEENPILKELAEIRKELRSIDKATCKNFLVRCLADFEKGNKLSDVEIERFWEQYHHYTEELKENTYIKEWTERLKKEGKI